MKVTHFCKAFSKLSETFIYDVIIELERKDVQNVIVARKIIKHSDRPFNKNIVVQLPAISLLKRIEYKLLAAVKGKLPIGLSWNHERKQLRKLLQEHRPDVIHAHYGPLGCVIMPVALELNIPLVVSFHGFDAFQLPNDTFWKKQLMQLFQGVTTITVVSELMKQHLIQLGCSPEKLQVIHVGKRIQEYALRSQPANKIQRFLTIGRMVEKKGHFDLLEVFKKLLPNYPDLTLTVIGDGPLLEDFTRAVSEQQLQDHIQVLGAISHEEVRQHLYNADAFILCSKTAADGDSEGVPTVLMEAQAIGLPCVTTRHSGIPEVIPSENHWLLAPEGSPDAIAAATERLITSTPDKIEAVVKAGRQKIEKEFNLETEVTKLKQLFKLISKQA